MQAISNVHTGCIWPAGSPTLSLTLAIDIFLFSANDSSIEQVSRPLNRHRVDKNLFFNKKKQIFFI